MAYSLNIRDKFNQMQKAQGQGFGVARDLYNSGTNVKTPEYMVKMDDYLESTVKGYEDYAEAIVWSMQSFRVTTGNTANELKTSSRIEQSDVELVMFTGYYTPVLKEKFFKSKTIETITVVRLAHIEEELSTVLQQHDFSNCKFTYFEEEGDYLFLAFRMESFQVKTVRYSQSGDKAGNNVFGYSFTENKDSGNNDDDKEDNDSGGSSGDDEE